MKGFLLFACSFVMFVVMTGCGGEHRTAQYPDVEGVYDLQGTLVTNCWSADGTEQTYNTGDRVSFLQPESVPSQVTMSGGWSGVVDGVLDEQGAFAVLDGNGDPQATTSYQGTFRENWEGEVVYHEGTLMLEYAGRCYDGRDGYISIQFWGPKIVAAPPHTGGAGDGGKG